MSATVVMASVLLATAPTSAHAAQAAQVGTCDTPLAESHLDINNVRARIFNNGALFYRRGSSQGGYEVPAGGGTQSIFAQALFFAGLVEGELRVAAARYAGYEFWAGPLDETTGLPPSDCAVFDRIYKISRSDIFDFDQSGLPTQDLADWPTGLGAPTLNARGQPIDVMGEPLALRAGRVIDLDAGERPALIGDQMLWWVMNDAGNEHTSTHTSPLNLEVHATAFAVDGGGHIGNATFYRYRIFNRGSQPIDSSFVGVWQDADLGQAHNDYSGTDTTLGLAFTYNATNDDGSGFNQYGLSPPAVGLDYVRGPLVNGERIEMTTNLISFNDAGNFGDPQAAEDYWNYVHARWRYGPLTVGGHGYDGVGPPTDFSFPGDPVTGEFWSIVNSDGEGTRIHSNDMRVTTGSGPFVFAPGEEQEVVIAVVWARGVNHLDSVTELRDADRLAQSFSDSDFVTSVDAVDHPDLSARIGDRNAILEWTNAAASNNAAEGYSEYAPWLDATYEFEGYDVFQFDSPADSSGSRIATYDVTNGITRILDIGYGADSLGFVAATGRDSGITHEHAVGGLDNYQTYYFGVQAYAYQGVSTPKVIRSSMARVAVEPKPASGGSDAGVLDAIGIVPNPYRARSAYEVASEDRQVRFVNVPTESAVTIFTLSGSRIRDLVQNGDGVLRWDLRNEAGRQVASGAYLIRVRVPGIGAKALKFFLVRSNP